MMLLVLLLLILLRLLIILYGLGGLRGCVGGLSGRLGVTVDDGRGSWSLVLLRHMACNKLLVRMSVTVRMKNLRTR